jgi:SanA protein
MTKILYNILVGLLLTIFGFVVWYAAFVFQYKNKIYSDPQSIPEHYSALVLGAQIKGSEPSYMLKTRIEAASILYQEGKVEKLIMSGDNRFEYHNEPQVMIDTALELGIPQSVLQPDYAGRSTYESCYRAKHIFGQTEIIIISQRYHLPRAIYLCEKMGLKAIGFEAGNSYGLSFAMVRREILATVLAVYETFFNPRKVVGGEPIEI